MTVIAPTTTDRLLPIYVPLLPTAVVEEVVGAAVQIPASATENDLAKETRRPLRPPAPAITQATTSNSNNNNSSAITVVIV